MTAPVLMSFHEHCQAIAYAVERLCGSAASAGPEAAVPTCPGWTVRDLLAHQGMVHRWATAHLTGDVEAQQPASAVATEAEGRAAPDPLEWLRIGASALLAALEAASADLEAFVFLKDAPAPRDFWARRQCHETTIHAVDALAARLGRAPSAEEVARSGWPLELSLDGLDELLTGFLPRRSSRLRAEEPLRVAVRPSDADLAWLVEVGDGAPVTTRHTTGSVPRADVTFSGSALALHLGLWNRGGEVVTDNATVLARWREQVRVGWT